ncbi:hypothetical protein P7C73_g1293, partial [Tremellales sp. Uapishka_1]
MWPPESIWNGKSSLLSTFIPLTSHPASPDAQALKEYYLTSPIPIHPQPGVLIASILVSILGSYATLVVLGRRTSSKGLRNHGLLLLAAVCFAAVAVWGMHFVSMISIRLRASPDITWYLVFSKGMTTLSLFVPLIATTFAFWFLGSELDFQIWRVIISGIIVGLTIGLMHYSAAFKIPSYIVTYTAVTVVFSLILACVAATAALFLFFRLRAQWQDSFWKRGLCAIFLAAAVCGMHYLGLGGSSYYAKPDADINVLESASAQSRRLTIAICIMCGCILVFAVMAAILDLFIRREIRDKARQIVIASAAFDKSGKLLVKNDGTIPMQVIQTDAELTKVLGELDPRQSTFQWLYQLSFNWGLITPFVPRVLTSFTGRSKGKYKEPLQVDRNIPRSTWDQLLFRTRFVEASVLLAQQLDLSVESLGVMFDRVLTTGTKVASLEEENRKEKQLEDGLSGDDESSIHGITLKMTASEGVMLFVVREIGDGLPAAHDVAPKNERSLYRHKSVDKVEDYTQRGFRMAETRFFSKTLAERMGVSKPEMDVFLSACKTYAKRGTRPVVQTSGAYLGLFGVRPTGTAVGGLDVLVYNFARHQIPAYRLPDVGYPLSPSMRAWIRECSNQTMGDVLRMCNEAVHRADTSDNGSHMSQSIHSFEEALYEFQGAIAVAIEALTTALRCWPTIQALARLSPEILEIPATDFDDKPPAQMVVLEVILPTPEAKLTPIHSRASGVQAPNVHSGRHESDKPPAPFVYTPYSLFTRSQTMLLRGKGFNEYCRGTTSDLNKVYPLNPIDLAGEVALADQAAETKELGLMDNLNLPWKKPSINKSLIVDIHQPHPSSPTDESTLQSPYSGDYEKGDYSQHLTRAQKLQVQSTPTGKKTRPGTGNSEVIRKGLTSLIPSSNKTKEAMTSTEDLNGEEMDPPPGPPIYAGVRTKTDGWYSRSMRALERNDTDGVLEGIDWQD